MLASSPSFVALLVELARNVKLSEREQEKAKEWRGELERVLAGERKIWREKGRERDRESTCVWDNWCVCKREKMRERKKRARERGVYICMYNLRRVQVGHIWLTRVRKLHFLEYVYYLPVYKRKYVIGLRVIPISSWCYKSFPCDWSSFISAFRVSHFLRLWPWLKSSFVFLGDSRDSRKARPTVSCVAFCVEVQQRHLPRAPANRARRWRISTYRPACCLLSATAHLRHDFANCVLQIAPLVGTRLFFPSIFLCPKTFEIRVLKPDNGLEFRSAMLPSSPWQWLQTKAE